MDYADRLKRLNAAELCAEIENALASATLSSIDDLFTLKLHARTNGHVTACTAIQKVLNNLNRKEKQEIAKDLVLRSSKTLRVRLLSARSCLTREYRKQFKEYTLDEENHRLLSNGGQDALALQWTNDGETNRGSVALVLPRLTKQ